MRKFSRRRRIQRSPPVCKAVPPPNVATLPPPGLYAQGQVAYRGPTALATANVSAIVPLEIFGAQPAYTGETTTADGWNLLLQGTIPSTPGPATMTLVGTTAAGDFLVAIGSADPISYDPYLLGQLSPAETLAPGAVATITIGQ